MAGTIKRLALSVGFTLTFIGGSEAILRATNPDLQGVVSPLIYQRNSGDAFTPGTDPGTRVYVSGRRRVASNKVAGKRVLVFGASAAYGEMFTAFTAFPGVAEQRIRQSTDTPIEVLNLAHGGMGSRQVGEMVFRAIEHGKADLLIIYTGNNEYHELRALKARSDRYNAKAEMLRRRMSKSYLYRQLREWFVPTEDALSPPEGEEWLPVGRMDVLVDQHDRDLGVALYEEHLRDIVLAAQQHNVPILLTTVASNSRDHIDNGTPGQLTQEGQAALGQLAAVVDKIPATEFKKQVEQKRALIHTESGLHKLGQLLLRAKLAEAAKDVFEEKELAALRPMTSNRNLRQTVRDVGTKYGVPVCDLAASLDASATDNIAGNEQFIDHCHPNAKGHQVLGEALAMCIAEQDLLKIKSFTLDVSEPKRDLFRVDHYKGHRHIPGIKQESHPYPPNTAEALVTLGHQNFVADKFDQALNHYRKAAESGAPVASIQHSIALVHLYQGKMNAARNALQQAADAGSIDADKLLKTLAD